jgi:hypothetical protein
MFKGSASSCNVNLSLEGFILFVASSFYYTISSIHKSKPRRNEKHTINVEKYAPQTAEKFPWEAEIKPGFVNPFMNNNLYNGPLLCTFITDNDDERSSEEKMKAVAMMACYRGHFNVACPCCQ